MRLTLTIFVLLLVNANLLYGQIRMGKLVLKANERYTITESDILVLDTLIMNDSSVVILNRDKVDNYIHSKYAKFGKGCRIEGNGINGIAGRPGRDGYTDTGPCKNGTTGTVGSRGTAAKNGVNLFLYFDQLSIDSKLTIELSGGDGGDGGKGGNGGGGSPGTRLCNGGDGGIGAPGAQGGDGGDSGNLTITCGPCPDLRSWLGNKIVVRGYGGNEGLGGEGGLGGLAGLINSGNLQDGERGAKGKDGDSGKQGKNGAINFE